MQIFHPSANTLSRLTVFGSVVLLLGPVAVAYALLKSPYQTKVGVIPPQPSSCATGQCLIKRAVSRERLRLAP